jgi:hypothetical protein
MLKLGGWGLRPWMEFEVDPVSGHYTKRFLKSDPTLLYGYAGFGQELKVKDLGVVGSAAWNLFEPGLELAHRSRAFYCELAIREPNGNHLTFRYRRKDPNRAELLAEWSARAVQQSAPPDRPEEHGPTADSRSLPS